MAKFKKIHCIYSETAIAHGINNFPGVDYEEGGHCPGHVAYSYDTIWNNIQLLYQKCINPIIEGLGEDNIKITSSYRSYELNKKIGGGPNSQHIQGYAVDLISTKYPTALLWNLCYENLSTWNQLIWEFPERGIYTPNSLDFSWVHVSYIEGNNPKTTSVSSKKNQIHEEYKNESTTRIGDYTHGIVFADENLK